VFGIDFVWIIIISSEIIITEEIIISRKVISLTSSILNLQA